MKREDFDAWRKDPVTKYIFAGIAKAMAAEKAEWMRQSWDGGTADQLQLTELRTRADALGELIDNTYEKWLNWNGDDD